MKVNTNLLHSCVVLHFRTTRLASFPDYLLLHLKKFTLLEDWTPIKLDVAVDMPETVDLSILRGHGLQPGEEPLPDLEGVPPPVQLNEEYVRHLVDVGFPPEAAKKAVFFTDNQGLEQATNWVMEHIGDSDFADPFVPPGTDSRPAEGNNNFQIKADVYEKYIFLT